MDNESTGAPELAPCALGFDGPHIARIFSAAIEATPKPSRCTLRNSTAAPEFFSKLDTESLSMIEPNQIDQIKEHMEVLGNDGLHVGVIDRVEAGEIKLAKNDTPDGLHHFLPLANVEYVDDRVHLNRSSIRAMAEWR